VLTHAAAVHGLPVSIEPVELARVALKRLGLIRKSNERDRRPTDEELMSMLVVLIQDFDARAQDSFARIDPRVLYAATRQFFDGLLAQSQEIDASRERWMLDRSLHETPQDEDPDDVDPHDQPEPEA
jgi:hypothetical protein